MRNGKRGRNYEGASFRVNPLDRNPKGAREMSTQKQSGLLRLRSDGVSLAVAVFLSLTASVIPRNVVWAQAPNEFSGEWRWRDGGYSGGLHITQNSDGTFSGKYDPGWRSTIEEGHIQGDQIEFVRLIMWRDGEQKEQRYKLTLDRSGNTLRMKGRWTGFDGSSDNGSGDFSAEKVSSNLLEGRISDPVALFGTPK